MEDLNLKARQVLETIYNNGGVATTAEIKENTGIKNLQIVKYHAKDVLADSGFTTYEKITTDQHPSGVLKFEITEEGEDRIAHLYEDGEDVPIKKRMEDLEDRFGEVEDLVSDLIESANFAKEVSQDADVKGKKAITASEEAKEEVESLSEQMDHLTNRVDRLSRYVDNLREGDVLERLERVETMRLTSVESRLDRLEQTKVGLDELEEIDNDSHSIIQNLKEELKEDEDEGGNENKTVEMLEEGTETEEEEELPRKKKVQKATRFLNKKANDSRHWQRGIAYNKIKRKFGYDDGICRKAWKRCNMKKN
jgi:hypothetical protein